MRAIQASQASAAIAVVTMRAFPPGERGLTGRALSGGPGCQGSPGSPQPAAWAVPTRLSLTRGREAGAAQSRPETGRGGSAPFPQLLFGMLFHPRPPGQCCQRIGVGGGCAGGAAGSAAHAWIRNNKGSLLSSKSSRNPRKNQSTVEKCLRQ